MYFSVIINTSLTVNIRIIRALALPILKQGRNNKMKRLIRKGCMVLTLSCLLAPSTAFAASWDGVNGISDAVVNSIAQYETEAASYSGQITTLNQQIAANQGMIDTWTANLKQAQDARAAGRTNDLWYGREAECQQSINNNNGPMQQRIAERNNLIGKQNAARNNANAARAEASRQAAAIKAAQQEQNKPKPSEPPQPPTSPSTPPSTSSSGDNGTGTSSSSVSSESSSESSTSESKDKEDSKDSEKEKDKDKDKEDDKKPSKPEKPSKPSDGNDAGEIIIDNEDEIKEDLNDFDHSKTIDDFIVENKDGEYEIQSDAIRVAVLDSINQARADAGLDPVEMSDALVDYAAAKAQDAHDYMDKKAPNGDYMTGHEKSKATLDEYDKTLAQLNAAGHDANIIIDDLAYFVSNFQDRKFVSAEDARDVARKIAQGLVGEYSGFLSDGHRYDILNPNAHLANVALKMKTVDAIDAWTGQTVQRTVWYLAYVYTTI